MSKVHPLAGIIGGFAADPLWDKFLEQMTQGRCENENAQPTLIEQAARYLYL